MRFVALSVPSHVDKDDPVPLAQWGHISILPPLPTFENPAMVEDERLALANNFVVDACAFVDRVAHVLPCLPMRVVKSSRRLVAALAQSHGSPALEAINGKLAEIALAQDAPTSWQLVPAEPPKRH